MTKFILHGGYTSTENELNESPDLPPNPKALASLKNMAQDLELILLKDCEWKVFNL